MGKLRITTSAALLAALAIAIAVATTGAGASSTHQRADARAATSPSVPVAPIIPAKLACSDLVQNGGPPKPGVPDFANLNGAPTRISSATVVAGPRVTRRLRTPWAARPPCSASRACS